MQISETLSQDLHKQFTVTFAASELDSRVNARLEEMKPRVNLKGFRPGKAPVSFLKKQFGKSIMGEVVEQAVNEGSQKAIADNKLKPALQPRVEPVGSVEDVVDGKADLTFKVIVDLMPDFETADPAKLTVERLTSDITDADMDEALDRLAKNVRNYATKDGAAEKDDVAVIDYEGSIDGVPFEGGKGSDFSLTLGSGTFIPGFEDGLIGAKAGEDRDVSVTFPTEYHAPEMAGKDALFEVTVKEVKAPEATKIDDELAKKLGLDDLATLKTRVREQLENDYKAASRLHLKRRVLDALDTAHDFPLPPAMVEHEFTNIWAQVDGRAEAREQAPPPTKARPKTSSRPNTARSPSAACAWAWCWASWASRTASPSPMTKCSAPSWPGPASSPARNSRCSSSMPTIPRPRPKSARPCSRTRWWTSSPNWRRSMTARWTGKLCSPIPEDEPADGLSSAARS